VQVKQFGIARDDTGGMAGYREFQKFIIFDITAGQDRRLHVHGFRDEPLRITDHWGLTLKYSHK
jgi:hypothetical protein